jgi:hypothetical protein
VELAGRGRKPDTVPIRELLAVLGVERFGVSVKALAEELGRSRVTLSTWVNRGAARRAGEKTFVKLVDDQLRGAAVRSVEEQRFDEMVRQVDSIIIGSTDGDSNRQPQNPRTGHFFPSQLAKRGGRRTMNGAKSVDDAGVESTCRILPSPDSYDHIVLAM